MKTWKLFLGLALLATLFAACYGEAMIEEQTYDPVSTVTLNQLLNAHELWYVDINRANATGHTIYADCFYAFFSGR